MSKPDKRPDLKMLNAAMLAGQVGFTVAIPIVVGVLAGTYLDRWLNAHGLILVAAILLGVAGGGYAALRMLMKEISWKK